MLLLNSPHNPTGRVLSRAELEAIAQACVEHDLIAVTDEVYEHLVYDGEHVPLATLPGMAERTLTISSAGKSFSFTGWKIGWCSGPPRSSPACAPRSSSCRSRAARRFRSPWPPRSTKPSATSRRCARRSCRPRPPARGLAAAGFGVTVPQGGYFVQGDVAALGVSDAAAWCRELPARAGIVAIPTSPFYDDADAGRTLVRFAFCKRPEVIEEAVARLAALRALVRSAAMGAMSGSASTEIDAPIEAVWAIVQDVESAPRWQRGIDSMQRARARRRGPRHPGGDRDRHEGQGLQLAPRFTYDAPARLSWVQERGDLKSLAGSWQLEDLGGGRTRACTSSSRPRRAAVALHQGRARGEAARGCSSTAAPPSSRRSPSARLAPGAAPTLAPAALGVRRRRLTRLPSRSRRREWRRCVAGAR